MNKLASLNISELSTLWKQANGDMLQYFQDNPEKLKEKKERDARKKKAKEKKASIELADLWGRELAKEAAFGVKIPNVVTPEIVQRVAQAAGPAKKTLKLTNLSKGLLAAGAGYGVAKASKKPEEKTASFKDVAEAVSAHGPALKNMATAAGSTIRRGVEGAGKVVGGIKDPLSRNAAAGAMIGGVGKGVEGFIDPKENPYTGEKQRIRTALRKGFGGAAGGAATGALLAGGVSKLSSVTIPPATVGRLKAKGLQAAAGASQAVGATLGYSAGKRQKDRGERHSFGAGRLLSMALPGGAGYQAGRAIGHSSVTDKREKSKEAAGLPGLGNIGSMVRNFAGQAGSVANKAFDAAAPTLRKGIGALGSSTMGQAAAGGAMGGAALGAAKGLVAPGTGPNGQKNSRLGAMTRGAVRGAAVGGTLGAGAKAALPRVQSFAAQRLKV